MSRLPDDEITLIKTLLNNVCEWLEDGKLHMASSQLILVAKYLEDKAYEKN